MRSGEEILTILDHTKPELEQRFGVRRIGLYGSYAHGTQTESSDVDLVVELKEPRFDALAGLYIYMEHVLGREVDIRRLNKKIDTPFMRRIEREALFVYMTPAAITEGSGAGRPDEKEDSHEHRRCRTCQ